MTSPTTAPRRPRTARPKLDAVAAAAVELAREALEDVTEPGQVGEHLRVEATGERLVTHVFECTMPGYRGWSWVAVLARAPRAKFATVAETALLPGDDDFDGFFQVGLAYFVAVHADGAQGAFVDNIGNVGTGCAGSGAAQQIVVDSFFHLIAFGVNAKDRDAAV